MTLKLGILASGSGTNAQAMIDAVESGKLDAEICVIIANRPGAKVLDLFGGTGQLGIEAKSRGAGEVVIVDLARDSVKLIKENVEYCKLDCKVVQADAISYLHGCGSFDLIFIDPPYDSDLAEKALKTIKEIDILSEGGIIVCETRKETPTPELEAPYKKRKEYTYGKIKLSVYTKES